MFFKKTEKKKEPKPKETLSEAILGIASVLVSGLFIITFIIQAFEIPSKSMEKTLLVGDHVFVDRLTAAPPAHYLFLDHLLPYRPIHRGEVAVFISPAQSDLHLVKRIIGVPGDRIHLENGVLYVNGVRQNEPYVYHLPPELVAPTNTDYRDNFPRASSYGANTTSEWPMIMQMHLDHGDLVVAALGVLKPGGILLTSANAAGWPAEKFLANVESSVRTVKRSILNRQYFPQPPDFPANRAEPAYLKTVWVHVN